MGHAQHDFVDSLRRPAFSIARSNSGIRLSAPSSEKLLAPTNFFRTNCSKIDGVGQPREDPQLLVARQRQPVLGRSMRSCSHSRTANSSMCMNCTPMYRQ